MGRYIKELRDSALVHLGYLTHTEKKFSTALHSRTNHLVYIEEQEEIRKEENYHSTEASPRKKERLCLGKAVLGGKSHYMRTPSSSSSSSCEIWLAAISERSLRPTP